MDLNLLTLGNIIKKISENGNSENISFLNEYIGIFGNTKKHYLIIPIIIENKAEGCYYGRMVIFSEENKKILFKTKYFTSDSIIYLILFLLNSKDVMTYLDEDTGNGLGLYLSKYRLFTKERVRVLTKEVIIDLKDLLIKNNYEN